MGKNAGQAPCFDCYNKNIDERTFYSPASDRGQFLLQSTVFPSSNEHLFKTLITFLRFKEKKTRFLSQI